jgi:hypothetical protein
MKYHKPENSVVQRRKCMVYAEFMHTAPIGSNFPILDSTREQKYETIEGNISISAYFHWAPEYQRFIEAAHYNVVFAQAAPPERKTRAI